MDCKKFFAHEDLYRVCRIILARSRPIEVQDPTRLKEEKVLERDRMYDRLEKYLFECSGWAIRGKAPRHMIEVDESGGWSRYREPVFLESTILEPLYRKFKAWNDDRKDKVLARYLKKEGLENLKKTMDED